MPTVTLEKHLTGYAHCRNSTCPGNDQEQVPAVRETSAISYVELGGDMPGIQNSTSRLMFARPEDIKCEVCLEDREISDQVRPVYPVATSQLGFQNTDPRYLLDLKKRGKIVAPGASGSDDGGNSELEAMRRELAELRGFVRGQSQPAQTEPADPVATAPVESAQPKRRGRPPGSGNTPAA